MDKFFSEYLKEEEEENKPGFPFVDKETNVSYLPSNLKCIFCISLCRICYSLNNLMGGFIKCFLCERLACPNCTNQFNGLDWKESVEKFNLVNNKDEFDLFLIYCCEDCFSSESVLQNKKDDLAIYKKKVKKFNKEEFLNSINCKIAGKESEFIHRKKREVAQPGDSWWSSESEDSGDSGEQTEAEAE